MSTGAEGQGTWLSQMLQSGAEGDRRALAAAVQLSLRSNHPVSRAMALVGESAHGYLPDIAILNFKSVPGSLRYFSRTALLKYTQEYEGMCSV